MSAEAFFAGEKKKALFGQTHIQRMSFSGGFFHQDFNFNFSIQFHCDKNMAGGGKKDLTVFRPNLGI